MKTLTIELQGTPGVALPGNFAPFAGFQLTLTKVSSGGQLVLPVEQKLLWQFGEMKEGEQYNLLIECVDTNGERIMALPVAELLVPVDPTYTRLDGFTATWS